jgi:chromosomal replication initiator protein
MSYIELNFSSYSLGLVAPREGTISVRPRLTTARIKQAVSEFYRIPEIEMISHRRQRHVARPRQVAMYLTRELTPMSLPEIGRRFGKRDHTTVIHAIKTVERLIGEDSNFAVDVDVLRGRLA